MNKDNQTKADRDTSTGANQLSFRYEDGKPAEITIGRYVGGPPGTQVSSSAPITCSCRVQEAKIGPIKGEVYVYCSFRTGDENPAPFADGRPAGYQTVTLGQRIDGAFVEAVRFGMVDDDRASPKEKANYTPGVFDGSVEYYGMYARPGTTYDFRLIMNLDKKRMTVWVSGRGDDEWLPLAVDAQLMNPVSAIDTVRVDQLQDAPGIENLAIQSEAWPQGEAIRPHPKAKRDRVVGPGKGFKFQSMRSLWRQADRHVTVARTPNVPKGWWLGFPDVVQTGPATLVCTHNDGPGHGGGGKVWVHRSCDLGKTWDDAVVVLEAGVNCPRLQRLCDGSLLLPADVYPGVDGNATHYNVFFFRSADGGRTWSRIGRLDPVEAGGHSACVPSRVTELADGSWLVSGAWLPGDKPWQGTETETLEFYRSTDKGKTWEFYSRLEPDLPHSISEGSVVPLPDGRWLLFAREAYGRLPGVKTCSNDEGRTWDPLQDLPFPIVGRTCAGLLTDGRAMVTFRACPGPPALWAWIGDPDEKPQPFLIGIHFNDGQTVGLRDGGLHIDNDGICGQFTKYILRPPTGPESRIDVTAELRVVSNEGRAATLSVPFVGKLRFFPDRVLMAHDPSLRVGVTPGKFHVYRVVSEGGRMTLFVDGKEALTTDNTDRQMGKLAWSPVEASPYPLAFGNEESDDAHSAFDWVPEAHRERVETGERAEQLPDGNAEPSPVFTKNITPPVTGYSIWRRIETRTEDPRAVTHVVSWKAADGVFPDQYQLDHIIEVEATISGCDQGYSGWVELDDGRIFVVNYTDDTARWNCDATYPPLGVSWIRGTYILPSDYQ